MKILLPLLFTASLFASCSVSKKLERSAREDVLTADVLKTAHVGISVYEPATNSYWFNYQGDKYFVPASNTKIPTCYAAMKYLGDSLVGARVLEYNNDLIVYPSGDPTFLNQEFVYQPVFSVMKTKGKAVIVRYSRWHTRKWGSGWSWNDYQEDYMTERSPMPLYGNLVQLKNINDTASAVFGNAKEPFYVTHPKIFSQQRFWSKSKYIFNESEEGFSGERWTFPLGKNQEGYFRAARKIGENLFYIVPSLTERKIQLIPFAFSPLTVNQLLEDTIGKKAFNENRYFTGDEKFDQSSFRVIRSQPTDSLLKPMMHRSDNFFAEQSLLMVSNELLGFMNDEKIIDTLLKGDFKDLPQKPRWVDGSGLSRYNLFTPQDFVFILNKMKNEFGTARLKTIFATGGEGTLSNYYKTDSTFIYAKTGSLSGVVALSGFLETKKGKQLLFSVQVNNHNGSATDVRRAVEKFVHGLRERY